MYNVKSKLATEFIDNDEILESLKYGEKIKITMNYIDNFRKSQKFKGTCT